MISRTLIATARSCSRRVVVNQGSSFLAQAPSAFRSAPSARLFSSAAREDLAKLLSREAAEEVDTGNTAVPHELKELRTQIEASWKIVDDEAFTKLIRTLDDGAGKAQVYFHCQDNVENFADYEDEDADAMEPSAAIRMTVTCTRGGKTLVFGCVAEDAMVRIQSVVVTSDESKMDTILKDGGVDGSEYQGPEFDELAEDLQDAFHTYLEETVGINQDIATFAAMQADFQEQLKYVDFLEDAKRIVS